MAVYQYYKEQKLPADITTVWDFISSPGNLKQITPEHMGFEICSPYLPEKMYNGMIIIYRVSPLFRFRVTWVTEIVHIKGYEFFVDEQRSGPYKMWHHEHRIQSIDGGTLMTDIVTYKPPMGWLGALANRLFIAGKIRGIFDYREKMLHAIFGEYKQET